jgi:hypothetical protein
MYHRATKSGFFVEFYYVDYFFCSNIIKLSKPNELIENLFPNPFINYNIIVIVFFEVFNKFNIYRTAPEIIRKLLIEKGFLNELFGKYIRVYNETSFFL